MKKDLEIKAVEIVRHIRDTHYEQLKGKSWDQQVAFYQKKARLLHDELKPKEAKGYEAQAG
ncbi:MAG: hypothetical protein U1F76_01910 [Candidatus Competibacteraceae bacterium]